MTTAVAGPRRTLGATGLRVTSVGLGTGRLPSTNEPHVILQNALVVREALTGGINIIDCASNYAGGASEAVVGAVLQKLLVDGRLAREDVVICTKAGYDTSTGGHRLDRTFLRRELEASLRRLGTDFVDVFFLHNPEDTLERTGSRAFENMMLQAFDELEEAVLAHQIRFYGIASADGFRIAGPRFHPLDTLLALAGKAGGTSHHLRMIQLPFSLEQMEGWSEEIHGGRSVLAVAHASGVGVIASAALNRMQLPSSALARVRELSAFERPAQLALDFARSVPGIDCALFGTSDPTHVADALEVMRRAPMQF